MCDYLISFIGKLRQLPEATMMNNVLENFTVLQVRACNLYGSIRDLQILPGVGAEAVFTRKKSLLLFDHMSVYSLFIYSYLILPVCSM